MGFCQVSWCLKYTLRMSLGYYLTKFTLYDFQLAQEHLGVLPDKLAVGTRCLGLTVQAATHKTQLPNNQQWTFCKRGVKRGDASGHPQRTVMIFGFVEI